MMHVGFIFSLLLFVSPLLAKTMPVHLNRDDGSIIEGYLSVPQDGPNFPVVVFVDGSWNTTVLTNHEQLAARITPCGIGLLSLEKRGVLPKSLNQKEFLQHDCFEERLSDYILLLKALEEHSIPGCNGDCIILGGSEGGKIGPRLSLSYPNIVKGLVLVASGGGLSFAEEAKYQTKCTIQQMNPFKRFAYNIQGTLAPNEYDHFYAKMLASPHSLEIFGTKTWKWWASYLRYDLLSDLLQVNAPIYMIHGEEDLRVPIQSADLIKVAFDKAGKTNFTYARYKHLGHALTGREDVYGPMIEWITKTHTTHLGVDVAPPSVET